MRLFLSTIKFRSYLLTGKLEFDGDPFHAAGLFEGMGEVAVIVFGHCLREIGHNTKLWRNGPCLVDVEKLQLPPLHCRGRICTDDIGKDPVYSKSESIMG